MGNYNCQECVDKEVNIINELLLDNRYFGSDSLDQDNPNVSHSSRINDLRTSREDLKLAIEKTNLSPEQKNFVQKLLNDHYNNEIIGNEGIESLKLRIEKNNLNKSNSIKDNSMSQEQQKIIQNQKEQILAQQKIIEEFKKQQILLEEKQKKLKEEEELKNKIEQSPINEQSQEEDVLQGVTIKTLEPPKLENLQEEHNKEIAELEQKDNQYNEKVDNKEEDNEVNIEIEKGSQGNLRKNNHSLYGEQDKNEEKDLEDEEEKEKYEEKEGEKVTDSLNIISTEKDNTDIKFNQNQKIGQENRENHYEKVEIEIEIPNNHKSKNFKIESYEPKEQESNSYRNFDNNEINEYKNNDNNDNNENDDENDENNENNENNGNDENNENNENDENNENNEYDENNEKNENDDNGNSYEDIYARMKIKPHVPIDSKRSDLRKPIKPKGGEKEIDNNNYNNRINNDIQKMKNLNEKGPKDSERNNKVFIFKGSFRADNINNVKNELENVSIKEVGPKDSKRKDVQSKSNLNENNNNDRNSLPQNEKQYLLNQKKIVMNRNEINEEYNNILTNNPISNVISKAVLMENNNIQQNENGPYSHKQYHFVKKEIISSPEPDYVNPNIVRYNQNISQNQLNYSPKFNDLNNEALNTNYQNLENYDNKFSISENQNDRKEATQSSYQNEIELNLQNSQRDHDITISDRDNPLIYSDDKGNMNFLERKYMAYQNRMHQNNENY